MTYVEAIRIVCLSFVCVFLFREFGETWQDSVRVVCVAGIASVIFRVVVNSFLSDR